MKSKYQFKVIALFSISLILTFIFILNFVSSLPNEADNQINFDYATSSSNVNYSTVNVNNSLYWQGHTGTDGSWLNISGAETDPLYQVDKSNLAKLNQSNTFHGIQQINQSIEILEANQTWQYTGAPTWSAGAVQVQVSNEAGVIYGAAGSIYYGFAFITTGGLTSRGSVLTNSTTAWTGNKTLIILPTTTNPKVTGIRIYRGLNDSGSQRYWKVADVPIGTTTYLDNTPQSSLTESFRAYNEMSAVYTRVFGSTSRFPLIAFGNSFCLGWNVGCSGEVNTFIGNGAGSGTTTGIENVGIGSSSLSGLTTGVQNMCQGYASCSAMTSGTGNSCVGRATCRNMLTASNNMGFGTNSLFYDISGSNNVCVGASSCFGASGHSPTNNVVIGASAGFQARNTTTYNILLGFASGYYENRSNILMIDNNVNWKTSRDDAENESIIYGVMGSSVANQFINFNVNNMSIRHGNLYVEKTVVAQDINITRNISVDGKKGVTASYNCTSYPNVTITGGIITSWSC